MSWRDRGGRFRREHSPLPQRLSAPDDLCIAGPKRDLSAGVSSLSILVATHCGDDRQRGRTGDRRAALLVGARHRDRAPYLEMRPACAADSSSWLAPIVEVDVVLNPSPDDVGTKGRIAAGTAPAESRKCVEELPQHEEPCGPPDRKST